jgi:heme/copper-type cytochrome/quinol oxidase subunit 1
MKKLLALTAVLLISLVALAQTDSTATDLQGLTISKIWGGIVTFWGYLNWVFIVAFIIVSGIFNMYVSAENKAPKLDWFRKVPMAIWVLCIGVIMACIFIFSYEIVGKADITGLLWSIIFSMGIYKLGIDKLIKWLATRFGLKFNKEKDE